MAFRSRGIVRAVGVAVVVAAGLGVAAAFPSAWASTSRPIVPPSRLLPGRSVTTTLNNHTGCQLQLGGGVLVAGHLSQYPPAVIQPGASGTWKVIGWSAYSDPDASVSLFYEAKNCPIAGQGPGYWVGNTAADGFSYHSPACGWGSERLQERFTSQNAYHATLTIDLYLQTGSGKLVPDAAQGDGGAAASRMRPMAGNCVLPIQPLPA